MKHAGFPMRWREQRTRLLQFERLPAARRFATLGLVLGVGGVSILCASSLLASAFLAPAQLISVLLATALGAFLAAVSGVAFSFVSLALSREYWRRALVSPSAFAALPWLISRVD